MTDDYLHPVSYHLRNFNKYERLDLTAAELGNITIVGENAAGKTTLANCFYPMLIDGSIASPSFNPAKGTERVNRSAAARNSARDTRTFESMLLGWGRGAMLVRTGYTYMLMRSDLRQVILGIGALRITGGIRRTWWFAVIDSADTPPLEVQTCDPDGNCLDKKGFLAANEELGTTLHIFDSAAEYRAFVAAAVYGFKSDNDLGKLATAYRLLASPILTGGSAKFSPIKDALRDAQEGIDEQLIVQVARSQRELNRQVALAERIQTGITRLEQIRSNIFWRNMQHLNELRFTPYSEKVNERNKNNSKLNDLDRKIKKLTQQRELSLIASQDADDRVTELIAIQAQQHSIIDRRQQYTREIDDLNRRLTQYTQLSTKLAQLQTQQVRAQQQLQEFQAAQERLRSGRLAQWRTDVNSRAGILPALNQLLGLGDWPQVTTAVHKYRRTIEQGLRKHASLEDALSRTSADIGIVRAMTPQMDQAIDEHVHGMGADKSKAALHTANADIHDAGAAQMSERYEQLRQQQAELLARTPDLVAYLEDEELSAWLAEADTELQEIVQRRQKLTEKIDAETATLQRLVTEIRDLAATIEPEFDEDDIQASIKECHEALAALVVDPDIDAKVNEAKTNAERQKNALAKVGSDISSLSGQRQNVQEVVASLKRDIQKRWIDIGHSLKVLRPFAPADAELSNADEAVAFSSANNARISESDYAQLGDVISRRIHARGGVNGDRSALDTLFDELGQQELSTAMFDQRTLNVDGVTTVAFDVDEALRILQAEQSSVKQAVDTTRAGNNVAHLTFVQAAASKILKQFGLIEQYNAILRSGAGDDDHGIRLKVELVPDTIDNQLLAEVLIPDRSDYPLLEAEVLKRLDKLARTQDLADSDEDFYAAAQETLDTRLWTDFKVLIRRKGNASDDFEEVDDKFVQSGGSGAEKAQAMVLPLLLVPKMLLDQAEHADAPHLVMFDEFADKLDPDTAQSFTKTIGNFGFNFIATMPIGAQNKILADGITNRVYDVIAPRTQDDGQFHLNRVQPVLTWAEEYDG